MTWHSAGECGIFPATMSFYFAVPDFLVIWGVEGIKQKFVEEVYGNKAAVIRLILTIVTVAAGDFWHFFFVRITICREL